MTEVYPEGQVPTELCNRHQGWTNEELLARDEGQAGTGGGEERARAGDRKSARDDDKAETAAEEKPEKRHPFRNWLHRIFGGGGGGGRREEAKAREKEKGGREQRKPRDGDEEDAPDAAEAPGDAGAGSTESRAHFASTFGLEYSTQCLSQTRTALGIEMPGVLRSR
jgi:hypothetical protein